MSTHRIQPTDPARRRQLRELLNRETLPVIDPRPHRGRRGRWYWTVDTAVLTDWERARFAASIAGKMRGGYEGARQAVDEGLVAIPAENYELVKREQLLDELEMLWRGKFQ